MWGHQLVSNFFGNCVMVPLELRNKSTGVLILHHYWSPLLLAIVLQFFSPTPVARILRGSTALWPDTSLSSFISYFSLPDDHTKPLYLSYVCVCACAHVFGWKKRINLARRVMLANKSLRPRFFFFLRMLPTSAYGQLRYFINLLILVIVNLLYQNALGCK